jgi:hypothetical protein
MTEKNAVKKKIAKLLALGNGNANREEAKVALEMAGRLMEEWALEITDIELGEQDIVHHVIETDKRQSPDHAGCLVALAQFASVKVWNTRPGTWNKRAKYKLNVLGYEEDVALFEHFYYMLEATLHREYKAYKQTEEYANINAYTHGRRIWASFNDGFNSAVHWKLLDLFYEKSKVKTKTGTALVPLKEANIEDFFEKEMGIKLVHRKSAPKSTNWDASTAGAQAGHKTNFNNPVKGGGSKTLLLT